MATSSIFAPMKLQTRESVDALVRALEQSEQAAKQTVKQPDTAAHYTRVDDPKEIQRFFSQRKTSK